MKFTLCFSGLLILLISSTVAFGQEHKPVQDTIINNGIGLGGALAVSHLLVAQPVCALGHLSRTA